MNEESKFPIMEGRIMDEVFAEEKTGWIPVTERLPENMNRVLIAKRIIDEETVVDIGWYFAGEKTWYTNEFEVADVVAWQPLPEPYNVAD